MDTTLEAKSESQLALERAIAVLGGPARAARLLNVKDHRHQTVQSWLKNRVPAEYCPLIEEGTRAIAAERMDPTLIVTCEALRPDMKWGVLREAAAADIAAADDVRG
jgi:DNA-binding transcriptional regulator YdaS (Cro superfamily)